jgi:hypothetical protein
MGCRFMVLLARLEMQLASVVVELWPLRDGLSLVTSFGFSNVVVELHA